MPYGKTARIQAADRQFGRHIRQIKKVCENDLEREQRCLEEIFKIKMLELSMEHKEMYSFLDQIQTVSHKRDQAMKRSFERILQRFSFTSVFESEVSMSRLPRIPIPTPKRPKPKTAPGHLGGGGRRSSGRVLRPSEGKLTVTLPRCESHVTRVLESSISNTSLRMVSGGPATANLSKRSKSQNDTSRFTVPSHIGSKPRPSARQRYLQAREQTMTLSDLRGCNYLRVTCEA